MTPIARFIISFCSLVWTWTRIHQTNQHSSSSRLLQKGTEREKQEHSSAHAHSTLVMLHAQTISRCVSICIDAAAEKDCMRLHPHIGIFLPP
jgi:hypothetical protein